MKNDVFRSPELFERPRLAGSCCGGDSHATESTHRRSKTHRHRLKASGITRGQADRWGCTTPARRRGTHESGATHISHYSKGRLSSRRWFDHTFGAAPRAPTGRPRGPPRVVGHRFKSASIARLAGGCGLKGRSIRRLYRQVPWQPGSGQSQGISFAPPAGVVPRRHLRPPCFSASPRT